MLDRKPFSYVPPSGDFATAKFIIVGEQPGKREVLTKKPFSGPAGNLLTSLLHSVGLQRTDAYITNVIKDFEQLIENYVSFGRSKTVVSDLGQKYLDALKEELAQETQAKLVIAAGNVALWALTGITGVTKWRGSVLSCTLNPALKVIPIIHPATCLPPKNQPTNSFLIQTDLEKAKAILDGTFVPSTYQIKIEPTFLEAKLFLESLQAEQNFVAFDIEVFNEQVSCISFARFIPEALPGDACQIEAISIPFIKSAGVPYFFIEEERELWDLIATILENPSIPKLGQNIGFDAHFLLRQQKIICKNLNDTMIAQQILFGDFPKGLDFITSIWTNHNYYKDEGKRWFKVGGAMQQLWQYNATDSAVCLEAFPKQLNVLIKQDNMQTYKRQSKLIEPLVYMQERGIRVDVEGLQKFSKKLETEISELHEKLNSIAGCELNYNSPKQLQQHFYVRLGHKPYLSKTGSMSVDKLALKRLARKGVQEAALILEIRKRAKLVSTYTDLAKIDSDNRMRCSYNPVGTRFSRLSSSASIFGTGMNMQNIPHEILQFFLPDEGYVYYSFDLSQAENRIVAYVGNITEMIDAFETGKDVHRLTAGLIFNKPYDQVSDEPDSSPFGDGKSERDWGKRANHGLNYDLGYKTFALYYEMPETDAKFIVESYHRAYPGVRNNFHAYVRRQLTTSRTVTNLMGRKTLFLGNLDDTTFKEAYSCIPQGTVGDIINERGINYIYHNQTMFAPVELLVQVHDSIGFQIPLSCSWITHAMIIQAIKDSLEQPLTTHHHRSFTIPADLMLGLSLNKRTGKELKAKNWPSSVELLAQKLQQAYQELTNGSNA